MLKNITYEDLVKYDKATRSKIILQQRRTTLENFSDLEFLYSIHAENKNFLLAFMNFLAYGDMTLRTCQNMKTNLTLFFTWNRDYNNNLHFRKFNMAQAERFFIYLRDNGYTYNRARVIKTDITSLADFGQYVWGKDEYQHNGKKNRWYGYEHFWREVNIHQEEDELIYKKCNYNTFTLERLDTLKTYLQTKKDYMGVIILEHAYLGKELLTLKVDSEEFNITRPSSQSYLKWKEREGASHLQDVLVARRPDGTYIPMDLYELRRYAKMFSVFLGKEFIIC